MVHDIPITVMRASEIHQYMPPDVPTPQVRGDEHSCSMLVIQELPGNLQLATHHFSLAH